MEVIIDGSKIQNEAELHRMLAASFDFGPYYGHNLAALRDRLTTDVERPVHLVWRNSKESRNQLGDELFNRIVDLFRFVEKQDISFGWEERFTFSIDE